MLARASTKVTHVPKCGKSFPRRYLLLLPILAWPLFFLNAHFLRARLRQSPTRDTHVIVAYESVPNLLDGAERFIAHFTSLLATLPSTRVTFVARSNVGKCAPRDADIAALTSAHVRIVHASPQSAAFTALIAEPQSALLLPLSFFESCMSSTANASAEDFLSAFRAQRISGARVGVFSLDAQAERARGNAAYEPDAAQATRYRELEASYAAREARLYGGADSLAMLTEEDLSAIQDLGHTTPRFVINYRDEIDARLRSAATLPRERALAVSAALPPFRTREGFAFIGSGDSPTNHLAVRALLRDVWPIIRERLPGATLHLIGRPPSVLCAAHGIHCGWSDGHDSPGVIVDGLVEDVDGLLNSLRVSLAPMITGTGVNTKTGFFASHGLPIVGTPKAARGYLQDGVPAGVTVAAMGADFADAAILLHEDEAAWARASVASLEMVASLHDERKRGDDIVRFKDALFE